MEFLAIRDHDSAILCVCDVCVEIQYHPRSVISSPLLTLSRYWKLNADKICADSEVQIAADGSDSRQSAR